MRAIALTPSAWRAVLIGALYALGWIMALLAPPAIARRLAQRGTPAALRPLTWSGWCYLGRVLGPIASLAFLYLALREGLLDAYVIGLWRPAWGELAGWLPAVAGLSGLWAAVLWGAVWHSMPSGEDHSPRRAYGTVLGLPAHLLDMEAQATILRGALSPALGLYWGALAACVVRAMLALISPAVRRGLADPGERAYLYLDLASDLMAGACYAVTGNLWVSLIVRACIQLCATVAHQVLLWWQSVGSPPAPAEPDGTA